MADYPLMGVVRVMWRIFYFAPVLYLESVKLHISNFLSWLIHRSTSARMTYYPRNGSDVSRDLFKLWETSDNILLMVQNTDIVAMEH